jgi:hypothetical protein
MAAAGLMTGSGIAATSAPQAKPVVLVNCSNAAQVKPSSFTLACADGNDFLTSLHWVSWQSVAFGSGTEYVNDCIPTCVAGKTFSYPVLITLWRPQARPGHPGQTYFSRLTEIHTGQLHKAKGSTLPLTETFDLVGNLG